MQLALFDLDHTLIPFDSGGAFTRFVAERGALDAGFDAQYLAYCRRYVEGTLDMVDMHRFTVGALGRHPRARLQAWLRDFESQVAARVPASSRALVREHLDAGHVCVLVTATTRFVAEPFARLLGLPHLLATEPAIGDDDRYNGEIIGLPCFREHKLAHVQSWLARQGGDWASVTRSWFYSDSANDLSLLQRVSHPVAVNPDTALRSHALAAGWPIRCLSTEGS